MEGYGRLVEPVVSSATTAATWVNVQDTDMLMIIALGASGATALTVNVAKDASGTGALTYAPANGADGITRFYTVHSGVATLVTQAAAATATTVDATGDLTIVEVGGYQLPAGYKYVNASHATATMLMMLHSLAVQRDPAKLRSKLV